jgi:hypothetical protein
MDIVRDKAGDPIRTEGTKDELVALMRAHALRAKTLAYGQDRGSPQQASYSGMEEAWDEAADLLENHTFPKNRELEDRAALEAMGVDPDTAKLLIEGSEECRVCGQGGFSREDLSSGAGEFLGWCVDCDERGGFDPNAIRKEI